MLCMGEETSQRSPWLRSSPWQQVCSQFSSYQSGRTRTNLPVSMDLADAHAQSRLPCNIKIHTNTQPHFAIRLQRNDSFSSYPYRIMIVKVENQVREASQVDVHTSQCKGVKAVSSFFFTVYVRAALWWRNFTSGVTCFGPNLPSFVHCTTTTTTTCLSVCTLYYQQTTCPTTECRGNAYPTLDL